MSTLMNKLLYGTDEMDIAEQFEAEINRCLPLLAEDEWAVAHARDRVVEGLKPYEAFKAVVPVLLLAQKQSDGYAFVSCCWLASQLACISGTTEQPNGLFGALKQLHLEASKRDRHMADEVLKIAKWYRIENAI